MVGWLGHGGGGKRGLKACNFERTTLTKLPLATVQQCSNNNSNSEAAKWWQQCETATKRKDKGKQGHTANNARPGEP